MVKLNMTPILTSLLAASVPNCTWVPRENLFVPRELIIDSQEPSFQRALDGCANNIRTNYGEDIDLSYNTDSYKLIKETAFQCKISQDKPSVDIRDFQEECKDIENTRYNFKFDASGKAEQVDTGDIKEDADKKTSADKKPVKKHTHYKKPWEITSTKKNGVSIKAPEGTQMSMSNFPSVTEFDEFLSKLDRNARGAMYINGKNGLRIKPYGRLQARKEADLQGSKGYGPVLNKLCKGNKAPGMVVFLNPRGEKALCAPCMKNFNKNWINTNDKYPQDYADIVYLLTGSEYTINEKMSFLKKILEVRALAYEHNGNHNKMGEIFTEGSEVPYAHVHIDKLNKPKEFMNELAYFYHEENPVTVEYQYRGQWRKNQAVFVPY